MAVDPAKFVREVRAEVARVTWPVPQGDAGDHRASCSPWWRLAAMFFFLVDQVIGIGVACLFGMSG